MGLSVTCPSCGYAVHNLPESYAGKTGRCPKCDQKIQVPLLGSLRLDPSSIPATTPGSSGSAEHKVDALEWAVVVRNIMTLAGCLTVGGGFFSGVAVAERSGLGAMLALLVLGLIYGLFFFLLAATLHVLIEIHKQVSKINESFSSFSLQATPANGPTLNPTQDGQHERVPEDGAATGDVV